MKKNFFFFFIFLYSHSIAQVTVNVTWDQHIPPLKSDTIYYNPAQQLVWPDFKGKPGNPADALAVTSSGFGYVATMQYRNGKTTIDIEVCCYFSKQSSWVRKGRESDYALNHEQHHFDITYIIADLFIRELKAATFTRNNYGDMVDKIYKEYCRKMEQMQNDYDGQTRNGQLKDVQEEWNKKIDRQLEAL